MTDQSPPALCNCSLNALENLSNLSLSDISGLGSTETTRDVHTITLHCSITLRVTAAQLDIQKTPGPVVVPVAMFNLPGDREIFIWGHLPQKARPILQAMLQKR